MDVGDMLLYIWGMMKDNGYRIFDVYISFADVFLFVIIGCLFVGLICALLGGKD